METLYPQAFIGTNFNLGPLILQFFITKMRILIDIMLKEDFCEKLNFHKIKFYSLFLCKINTVNKSKF